MSPETLNFSADDLQTDPPKAPGEKPKLLVVDDETGPRESLKLVFMPQFTVYPAASGEEAVELAKEHRFSVAIVDIRMSGMNGIEVLRRIKTLHPHTEVVILTAYETLQTAREAVRHGASDYLSKPFDIHHIQEVVKRCLNRYQFMAEHTDMVEEDLSRAKNEFLSVLSHELNTPMNGIMGLLEILTQTSLSEEQKDLTRDLQDCSFNLFEKINDILNYARLSSESYSQSNELFNPSSLVLKLVQRNGGNSGEKETEVKINPSMPSLLQGPEYEIQIILLKLLDNAIKFNQEGKVHVSLDYQFHDVDNLDLIFKITDSGIGIDSELIRSGKLLNPFSQADTSSTRNYGGLGMGLALCERLCRHIGSELTMQSEVGKGSVFSFRVRVQKVTFDQ